MERRIETFENEDGKARYYTMAIVTYANQREIATLLETAKHYAYILHDRDKDRDPHYHLLVTFDLPRTFKAVRNMVASTQNTFTQSVKSSIGNVLTYFVHATDTAIADGKEPYDESEVIYDDEAYWRKRALQDGESWKEERGDKDKNEQFLNDLLSRTFSVERMGIKYGRDFMKNFRAYKEFRDACFTERLTEFEKSLDGIPAEVNDYGVIETFHATITRDEFEALQKWREENLFLNQRGNKYESN